MLLYAIHDRETHNVPSVKPKSLALFLLCKFHPYEREIDPKFQVSLGL